MWCSVMSLCCFLQSSTALLIVVNESNNWFALTHFHLLVTDSKHVLHFLYSLAKLQGRLVTMSGSLCTQTRLHNLTIQVLNTRVWFLDIWFISSISIHCNLEHGLAIITESFSLLNLSYITSFVNVWMRSHVISPDAAYLPCIHNWAKPVWTSFNQL